MGIPYYVASLLKQHKHIQKQCDQLETDCFGIDFNCFIHHYLQSSNPIGSVVVALYDLLEKVVKAKKVYIAFDGLVPMAKMIQQRYRRMRRGEVSVFDKHQISPGTPYMKELASTLRMLFPNVVISDTEERGEGEHKIFTWLRTIPADQRKRITIYGLDADLVVISVAQRSLGNIQLLRETEEHGYQTFSVDALASVLPVDADMWVQTCVMCFGNDFMPAIAMFSLREDGYNRAMFYVKEKSFADAIADEKRIVLKRAKPTDRKIVAVDGHALEIRMGLHLMDGVLDWEPVVRAFWKTFEWTLHYFKTSEVLDWMWYYPYAEAPLMETLYDYQDAITGHKWEHPAPPFTLKDQLQFILPEPSLKTAGYLPRFLDELYDEEKDTRHRWMKRFAWECDPFVSLPVGQLTYVTSI